MEQQLIVAMIQFYKVRVVLATNYNMISKEYYCTNNFETIIFFITFKKNLKSTDGSSCLFSIFELLVTTVVLYVARPRVSQSTKSCVI